MSTGPGSAGIVSSESPSTMSATSAYLPVIMYPAFGLISKLLTRPRVPSSAFRRSADASTHVPRPLSMPDSTTWRGFSARTMQYQATRRPKNAVWSRESPAARSRRALHDMLAQGVVSFDFIDPRAHVSDIGAYALTHEPGEVSEVPLCQGVREIRVLTRLHNPSCRFDENRPIVRSDLPYSRAECRQRCDTTLRDPVSPHPSAHEVSLAARSAAFGRSSAEPVTARACPWFVREARATAQGATGNCVTDSWLDS